MEYVGAMLSNRRQETPMDSASGGRWHHNVRNEQTLLPGQGGVVLGCCGWEDNANRACKAPPAEKLKTSQPKPDGSCLDVDRG